MSPMSEIRMKIKTPDSCPFCGGRAKADRKAHGFLDGALAAMVRVRCIECEARGGKYPFQTPEEEEAARERAIRDWNQRKKARMEDPEKEEQNIARRKLKPCPCCGGRAYLEDKSRLWVDGKICKIAYVRCTQCGMRAAWYVRSDFEKPQYAVSAAVRAWNRRTEKTEQTEKEETND